MTIIEFFIIFGASFLIGLSGAMMPGPVTTMTINETLKYMKRGRGWLVGTSIASGHAILEISLMFALWFGASFFFKMPIVMLVISFVGGGALVFFGLIGLKATRKSASGMVTLLEKSPDSALDTPGVKYSKIHPLMRPLALGFALSAASPGWWGWWATIGLGATQLSSTLSLEVFADFSVFITFYVGHVLTDYVWFTFLSSVVSLGKKRINIKAYTVILVATNMFLVGFGVWFVWQGIASFSP
ncbi:MAG: LysE family transporter [Candidatus Lokiarchaeota archaeon]|nr:LysE family transporter [Candidatus Lokiarchaeota archaeon]